MNETSPLFETVNDWLAKGISDARDLPALRFDTTVLTYDELDRLSNQVARFLMDSGVKPGGRVGLCLSRSIELIAVLVGILKTGAAYVPLDPSYPVERLNWMIEDAGLDALVVHQQHADLFRDCTVWESVAEAIGDMSSEPVHVELTSENAAYIIFTSGSTGRPKGIEMPHRALSNLIEWQLERKTFRPAAKVLQYSSISFDVSFQEIATTLASGGTLSLISDSDRKDPRRLLNQLVGEGIERLFLPYVAMRSMIEAAVSLRIFPEKLTEVITAGEQLRVDDAVRHFFRKIDGATLDNQYGPSETHVITAGLLEGNPDTWPDLPGIGTAIKNCGTLILDEAMNPVPEGDAGDLYLFGRNLALGYVGRKDLTDSVFIKDPTEVSEHGRMYKTGDLASYNPDGTIEFLGRRDHQIKIRGHRIEPGEINNAIGSFPGVGQSLTHAFSGTGNSLQLAAYFTNAGGNSVDSSALRAYLEKKIPDYMVPAFLIELQEIPYTPSGKVDLKSLPMPSIQNSRFAGETVSYASETEKKLGIIWSRLLGLEFIPRSAGFFELGGDSLRAVTLFLNIQETFGKEFPLATLSHAETIADLACLIDGNSEVPDLSEYRALTLLQQGSPDEIPLFLIHGGQGNVLVYNRFIQMLDPSQPVYAFQWSGWDGFRGESEIADMADTYFNELQRFYPKGKVRLGGYCIGGLIALELVKKLEDAGRELCGPVIVWDSPNLESEDYRKDEPWDNHESINAFNKMRGELEAIRVETSFETDFMNKGDLKPVGGRLAHIRKIPGVLQAMRMVKQVRQILKSIPERRAVSSYLRQGVSVPMNMREGYCLRTMVKAVSHHRSCGCEHDILYFRSDCVVGRYFGLNGWWDDAFLGFAELCRGKFKAYAVGGGHTDVLDIPEMGQLVREALQRSGK